MTAAPTITMPGADVPQFTGKERDTETGLDYFGARYYGSNMGRWMSPDWSEKPEEVPYANLSSPQSLNLYSYVGNNPIGTADADGHCCSDWADWVDSKVQAFRQDGMAANDKTSSPTLAAVNTFANGVTGDIASGIADTLRLGNGSYQAYQSAQAGDTTGAVIGVAQDLGRVGQVVLGVVGVASSASPAINAQEVATKAGPGGGSVETAAGRVDLTGDAHYSKAAGKDINTPHVHENASNTNPTTNQTFNYQKAVPRAATGADVRAAAKASGVRITPKQIPPVKKPEGQ